MAPRPHRIPRAAVDGAILKARAVRTHPLDWIFEPLEESPGYVRKKIFGCEAAYIGGRMRLVIAAGEEPWNGLMVATGREFHEALRREWPQLKAHSVLSKWLYLSQDAPEFERIAAAIARSVRAGDARIGVDPRPRKRRKKNPARTPER